MLQFKSKDDLQQLSTDDPAYPIVADLVQRLIVNYEADGFGYDPEADGWVCLVQEGDTERVLDEIWDDWTLLDIPWEGITREGDFFLAVFLANNQFSIVDVNMLVFQQVSKCHCPLRRNRYQPQILLIEFGQQFSALDGD